MLDAGCIRDFGLKYRAEPGRFVINYRSVEKKSGNEIDQPANIEIETRLINIIKKFGRLPTDTGSFR